MGRDGLARLTAALIAAAALLAMVPPLANGIERHGGILAAAWALGRFFTILTNLAIGIAFATIAWRGRNAVAPVIQGGLMLAIVLVGLVFNLLLPPLDHASFIDALGDNAHHVMIPLAVPLWWLAFAPHGQLGWRAPLAWALYLLAYSSYVLARAQLEPAGTPLRYPYFFMDVERLGWTTALGNMAAIALGFVLAGWLAVWIDRRLAPRD